jgi:ankyrin repeat protein
LGNTALHYASQKGQELVIEELMRWGANPQKANYEGKIPAEVAKKLSSESTLNTLN